PHHGQTLGRNGHRSRQSCCERLNTVVDPPAAVLSLQPPPWRSSGCDRRHAGGECFRNCDAEILAPAGQYEETCTLEKAVFFCGENVSAVGLSIPRGVTTSGFPARVAARPA